MKKIELAVICMLLLLVSCNKEETVNPVSKTPKYKTTLDISNYDQIGENHNKGLDYLLSVEGFPNIENAELLLNEYLNYDLPQEFQNELTNYTSNGLPQDFEGYFNNLESQGKITKHIITEYFVNMFNLFNDAGVLEESGRNQIMTSMLSMEQEILNSNELEPMEKMWLLGTASTLRHSFNYWTDSDKLEQWGNLLKKSKGSKSAKTSLKDVYRLLYGNAAGAIIYTGKVDAFEYADTWNYCLGLSIADKERQCAKFASVLSIKASYLAFKEK